MLRRSFTIYDNTGSLLYRQHRSFRLRTGRYCTDITDRLDSTGCYDTGSTDHSDNTGSYYTDSTDRLDSNRLLLIQAAQIIQITQEM